MHGARSTRRTAYDQTAHDRLLWEQSRCFDLLFFIFLHVTAFIVAVVVDVESSQTPEDDQQKRLSYTWKTAELSTDGACVLLIIAMDG